MNIQEACEVLEEFIYKNIKNNSFLSMIEFLALNQILLELTIDNKYRLPDKYYKILEGEGK